jgi:hypothetical protein
MAGVFFHVPVSLTQHLWQSSLFRLKNSSSIFLPSFQIVIILNEYVSQLAVVS